VTTQNLAPIAPPNANPNGAQAPLTQVVNTKISKSPTGGNMSSTSITVFQTIPTTATTAPNPNPGGAGGVIGTGQPAQTIPISNTVINGNAVQPPGQRQVNYVDGWYYMETALNNFSAFVELGVRHVDPIDQQGLYPSGSGFADMNVGTKSMFLDCELVQSTFQFKTYLPTGNFQNGTGTGHVSLEPSLLYALKLTPYSYLQGQTFYRFPLGGDKQFQGSLFLFGLSYNHLLWNCGCNIQVIGTAEADYYCITNGLYTDTSGQFLAAQASIFNVGAGIRLVLCDKVDFGVAYSQGLTSGVNTWPAQNFLRTEFRWRF
jgi:hypothetical protein